VARGVAALVSVCFAAAAFWELGGPLGSGHVASSAAVAIAAENMLRWGIAAPVTHYLFQAPTPADWYCHHPFGIFWWQLPFSLLLGHQELALRLPAALLSAATPPVLYAIGRSIWGPVAGAACAAAFAALPITLAFAAFHALEVPVIFTVLLSLWGTVRFTQTRATRWMVLSLVGTGLALHADWSAWFYVASVLAASLPAVFRRQGDAADSQRLRLWWLLGGALLVVTAAFYGLLFYQTGQLTRLLDAGKLRSTGWEQPVAQLLQGRRHRIDLCFTPVGVAVGMLMLPVVLMRAARRRTAGEALPLAVLVMAVLQYFIFTNGAEVHIFWPHLFAPWFALAMGALAATLGEALQHRARRGIALCVGLAITVVILPDGLRALSYGRRTGLRFDEKGRFIQPDLDKTEAMQWLASRVPADRGVMMHVGLRRSWALDWALERPTLDVRELPSTTDDRFPYFVADRRLLSGADLQRLAAAYRLVVVGPVVIADVRSSPAPAEGLALQRREPSASEALWRSAHAPVLSVHPDADVTWELRHHLDQVPNPPPPVGPTTLVAHNAALASGDHQAAARMLADIRAELDQSMARRLAGGMELLGVRLEPGVTPLLHVVFQANGPVTPDAWFIVRARQLAAPLWSTVQPNSRSRQVAPRFTIPTSLWRGGFLYETVIEIAPALGLERYMGSFEANEAKALEQGITLLEWRGR